MEQEPTRSLNRQPKWFVLDDRRYQVIQEIKKGGQGEVHLARREGEDGLLAIKILREDSDFPKTQNLQRFAREIEILRGLVSPHVVQLLASGHIAEGFSKGALALVMPYYEQSLRQRVQTEGPIGARDALWIMRQVLGGIRDLHEREVLHRDLKPDNILLSTDGVVVCDLGIADAPGTTITLPGEVPCSPRYAAREHIEGKATRESDLYSAALVLYYCVSGKEPPPDADVDPARGRLLSHTREAMAQDKDRIECEAIEGFLDKAVVPEAALRPCVDEILTEWEQMATTQPLSGVTVDRAGDVWVHQKDAGEMRIDLCLHPTLRLLARNSAGLCDVRLQREKGDAGWTVLAPGITLINASGFFNSTCKLLLETGELQDLELRSIRHGWTACVSIGGLDEERIYEGTDEMRRLILQVVFEGRKLFVYTDPD